LFLRWKEEKKKQREQEVAEQKKKREENIKVGKDMRSGREMFEFNPNLFVDDEDVIDTSELQPEGDEDEGPVYVLEATGTSLTRKTLNKDQEDEGGEELNVDYNEGSEDENEEENEEKEEEIQENLF